MLLCQILERLLFPMSGSALVLRLCCPVDASAVVIVQPNSPATGQSGVHTTTAAKQRRKTEPAVVAAEAAAAAAVKQTAQPHEFLQTLRTLEAEALPDGSKPLDLWALEAGGRYYVLLLE